MTRCHAFTCGNARAGEPYSADQCRKCWAALHAPAVARSLGRAVPFADRPATVPAGAGVVVGCYGLPGLARLQVETVRATCGPVPVLLADDGSGKDAEFESVREPYAGVEFWPSDHRRGHYAGDLGVFWKGLQWAHVRGLAYLCKLSQRFLWTRPGWLAEAVDLLGRSGDAVLMQRCLDNGNVPGREHTDLFVRTECLVLDVAAWLPHYREFDRPALGNPTELYVWDLVVRHFGGRFAQWPALPADRYKVAPGTLWHGSHAEGPYRELAARFGVGLDPEFTVRGWDHLPNWKPG